MNIDEKFLDELKSVLESKIVTANSDVGSQWELPNEEGLPLPNEMLTKIFDYLDFQEISRCAQVSQQFNSISELTWKSWDKITIIGKEVSNEFLEFLLEKGIKELQILGCKMLPPVPKHKFTNPLKLKSVLIADECTGYDGLISIIVKTNAMERIGLASSEFISNENISEFIASLPQTGSQLRSLTLPPDRGQYPCVSADNASGHNYLHFGHLGQNYCQHEAPTVISALTIFEV